LPDFFRERLIFGRRAADRRGNQSACKDKPVIGTFRVRLIREAGAMELRVQEISRAVPGEHAPGAVGAMRGGRESDDDETSIGIAKGRHGASPVSPIAIRRGAWCARFPRGNAPGGDTCGIPVISR